MTLLEILTSIAILALVMSVLLFFLLPNDDRKVKAEAQRLAAYLTAAGAEAVMCDGPVRVTIGFDDQRYFRERARQGAQLGPPNWKIDERVKPDHVRSPVKITTVQLPSAGAVKSGAAWVLWKGRATEGAVCVLELKEAVWSVIVDPNSGEVRIEKGRATLPRLTNPLMRKLLFSKPLKLSPFKPGKGGGSLPSAPGGKGAPGRKPDDKPPRGDAGRPPKGDAAPPVNLDAGVVDDPPPPEEPDPPELDAQVEDAEVDADPDHECEKDEDCEMPLTGCYDNECVTDPSGKSFWIRQLSVESPVELRVIIGEYLNELVATNKFNLVISFDRILAPLPTKKAPVRLYIAQAKQSGAGAGSSNYEVSEGLPSYRAQGTPTDNCSAGLQGSFYCVRARPVSGEELGRMTLYFQQVQGGRVCHAPLDMFADIEIGLTGSAGSEDVSAKVWLKGRFTRVEARDLVLPAGSSFGGNNLAEVLEAAEIEPTEDLNGDGDPDGWSLQFTAETVPVELAGSPAAWQGYVPDDQDLCKN